MRFLLGSSVFLTSSSDSESDESLSESESEESCDEMLVHARRIYTNVNSAYLGGGLLVLRLRVRAVRVVRVGLLSGRLSIRLVVAAVRVGVRVG